MPEESKFVALALEVAQEILLPPLSIRRGAALLYEITVDNNLKLTIDPRNPVRGDSAFQTDLCIFETKQEDVILPRVVLEFKTGITTHDVLTYSAKARKHKQVYPYLRYGLIVADLPTVPRRFFVHNEALDFCATLSATVRAELPAFFKRLITAEVGSSRQLESIAFEKLRPALFRTEVHVESRIGCDLQQAL